MHTSRHHLAEVIGERTLHQTDRKLLAHELAAYLLDEKMTDELESLIRDILQYRADKGVVEATVVSAHDLDDHVLREVQQILQKEHPKATSVSLATRHDPALVGGVRIDLANEQLDLSLRSKLSKFKRLIAS